MRGIYFVSLLWLLPLTVNGTVTPGQNHNFTNLRRLEITASKKSFTSQQHITSEQPAQDQLTTRKTVILNSFPTVGLALKTEGTLKLGVPIDVQAVQHNRSSVNISTKEPEAISPSLHSKASDGYFTTMSNLSPIERENTSLQPSTQIKHSVTSLPNHSADNQTAPTPSISTLSQSNSSTKGIQFREFNLTSSPTMVVTTEANNSRMEATSNTPLFSTTSHSQGTGKTSIPLTTTDQHLTSPSQNLSPSTGPTQPTTHISTETLSTKPVENNSTNAVTGGNGGGGTTQYTEGIPKTSMVTIKTSFIPITKENKTQKPPLTKPAKKAKSNKGKNHSVAVAWIIGGSLALMMLGFLVIYIKKRKLQKQQINNRDWAGPSPFLDGGTGNGQVELRTSNRISLSSFLPQRLSRRLSLLQEMDEELQDFKPSSACGDNQPGCTFGREVGEDEVQASNAITVVVPEKTQIGEASETLGSPCQATSSQTSDPLPMNDPPPQSPATPLEVVDLGQDHSVSPPPLSDAIDDNLPPPPPPLNDGQGQP